MNYISCGRCPCLNSDYEQGADCNLGFDSYLRWFIINGNPELIQCSKDCGLWVVEYKKDGRDCWYMVDEVLGDYISDEERWAKYK